VKVTRLDPDQRGLLSVGIAGVFGVGFGLYALVAPAFGLRFLTDEHSDLATSLITGTGLVAVTAMIAAELVVSAAAIRMTFTGTWPGRPFLLGRPAAATGVATFVLAGVLASLL
jgi:hypothetical protein